MENKKHLPMMGAGPIYLSFMFFCTGAMFVAGNKFFLPLFFFYWIFMSVLNTQRSSGLRIFWVDTETEKIWASAREWLREILSRYENIPPKEQIHTNLIFCILQFTDHCLKITAA